MDGFRISGKFFYNVGNLEDLRAQYRELAQKHHPDHGGKTETMQELNAEYDKFLVHFRNPSNKEMWEDAKKERCPTEEEREFEKNKASRKERGKKDTTWYVTPEQIARMSEGEQEAVDEFFEDNAIRLRRCARRVLRSLGYYPKYLKVNFVEVNDLINELYVTMRSGNVILDYNKNSISAAVCRCMRYAPVGGAPEGWVYHYRPKNGNGRGSYRKTQKKLSY